MSSVANDFVSAGSAVSTQQVVINVPDSSTQQNPPERNVATAAADGGADGRRSLHKGNCCMKTRVCLESSKFSFILGAILFVGGGILIGFSSHLSGDLFLVGPFCIAAGTILIIRGCITMIAKKQQRRQLEEREARVAGTRHAHRDRSRRNEELALSSDNLIIPPDYYDVVAPKPTVAVEAENNLSHTVASVDVGSLANFDNSSSIYHEVSPPSATAAGPPRQILRQLSSVHSQTSFPYMVSIAVDTSDLPTQLDTALHSPPSYAAVTNHSQNWITMPSALSLVTNQQVSSMPLANEVSMVTNQQESSVSLANEESGHTADGQTKKKSGVNYYLPTEETENPSQSRSTDTHDPSQ